MADPWMKFYPQDWRADERLRLCSLAARGLWIEMLAIMHRSERYGSLLIGNLAPTDEQLAMQVGGPPDLVSSLLGELERAGVFSRTSKGVIYSRRMFRDKKRAETAKKNGKKGGNPKLGKTKEKLSSDNPQDNQEIAEGDKPQKPEARSQSSVSKETGAQAPSDDPLKDLFDAGLALLISTGTPEGRARSQIGKWRKRVGEARALAAIVAARDAGVSQPMEWIEARLRKIVDAETGDEDAARANIRATAERYRRLGLADAEPKEGD